MRYPKPRQPPPRTCRSSHCHGHRLRESLMGIAEHGMKPLGTVGRLAATIPIKKLQLLWQVWQLQPSKPISMAFFFNDTATTEIYTLSLHDALPIWLGRQKIFEVRRVHNDITFIDTFLTPEFCKEYNLFSFNYQDQTKNYVIESREFQKVKRSEEHTSELQSLAYLVCRLLLEKKKKK